MISKIKNGVIYNDDFSKNSLVWTITPQDSSRFNFSSDGLTLKHGENPILVTMPLHFNEENKFCATIDFTHKPTIENDIASVCILADDNEYIECQSYFDSSKTTEDNYRYIRIIGDNYLYTFYKSNDMITWNEVGNGILENSNRLGFKLQGNDTDNSSDFIIKNIQISSDNYVEVRNVNTNINTLTFKDDNSKITEIPYKIICNKIIFDVTEIPINVKGTIIGKQNDLMVLNESLDMFGGNIYGRTHDISLYIDGQLVGNEEVDLGTFIQADNFIECTLTNESDEIYLLDKRLSILLYNPLTKGYKDVNIALKEMNELDIENLDYKKQIYIDIIKPNETIYFEMKISKSENIVLPFNNKYKFLLSIE